MANSIARRKARKIRLEGIVRSGTLVHGGETSFETLVVLSDSGALPTATEVKESMEVRAPLER